MFTWKLAKRLESKGWTNAHLLAKGAKLGYPTAWRIMEGRPFDRPNSRVLTALCKAFGVKRTQWHTLLEWTPD
jgi:hypothetical protein